jgi:hypothetical protein
VQLGGPGAGPGLGDVDGHQVGQFVDGLPGLMQPGLGAQDGAAQLDRGPAQRGGEATERGEDLLVDVVLAGERVGAFMIDLPRS